MTESVRDITRRRHLITAAVIGLVTLFSIAVVAAFALELQNSFNRAFHTVVAIANSRRDLDDLRVTAAQESTALFRYGRTNAAGDLTAFFASPFDPIAGRSAQEFLEAGVPQASSALLHAVRVHSGWRERMKSALVNRANPLSPNGPKISVQKALLDTEGTIAAINADGFAIRMLLDRRMGRVHDDVERRLPLIVALGAVLTLCLSAAGTMAVLMTRRFYAERSLTQRLKLSFDMPDLPVMESVMLDGVWAPIEREPQLGGDWYDARVLPDGRLFVTIGDAAGHGVAAAVSTAQLRREILGAAIGANDPGMILQRANRMLVETKGVLVATLCAYYDPRNREFCYASAGFPAPLLRRDDQVSFLAYGEPLLGIFDDNAYESRNVTVAPGDTIVLYTDGAIELSHDVPDGETRFAEAAKNVGGREHFAKKLFTALFGVQRQLDDVAILALEIP